MTGPSQSTDGDLATPGSGVPAARLPAALALVIGLTVVVVVFGLAVALWMYWLAGAIGG